MKTLKNILLAVALLGAVNAHATYSIAVTAPAGVNVNVSDLTTHVSHFTFTESVVPGNLVAYFDQSSSISVKSGANSTLGFNISALSFKDLTANIALNDGDILNAAHNYEAVVSWNITGSAVSGNLYKLKQFVSDSNLVGSDGATSFATMNINVVSVPEPAQTVASLMFLGCGGLVFVGRRLIKKNSAA